MAGNRRSSGGNILLPIIIAGVAVGAAYCIKTVQEQQQQEQYEAYQREHEADLQLNYDLVTATVLKKDVNEYDTGDWEYDDEGDTYWETYHITEFTYTIEYDYNGEHRTQTFTNREDYPGPGSTMQIYVDKLFGEFPGDRDFVKE